jgi:hypothetical protein
VFSNSHCQLTACDVVNAYIYKLSGLSFSFQSPESVIGLDHEN